MFKSLIRFLRLIISESSGPEEISRIPTWFFRSSFATEDAYENFVACLGPRSGTIVQWQEDAIDGTEAGLWAYAAGSASAEERWNLGQLYEEDEDEEDEGGTVNVSFGLVSLLFWLLIVGMAQDLGQVIPSLLVSTFLDVAPDVFVNRGNQSEPAAVELLWSISQITLLVYGTLLRHSSSSADAEENLRTVLNRMAPYFPFGANIDVKRDLKVRPRDSRLRP